MRNLFSPFILVMLCAVGALVWLLYLTVDEHIHCLEWKETHWQSLDCVEHTTVQVGKTTIENCASYQWVNHTGSTCVERDDDKPVRP